VTISRIAMTTDPAGTAGSARVSIAPLLVRKTSTGCAASCSLTLQPAAYEAWRSGDDRALAAAVAAAGAAHWRDVCARAGPAAKPRAEAEGAIEALPSPGAGSDRKRGARDHAHAASAHYASAASRSAERAPAQNLRL
jgi:hypothetical protein